MCWTFRLATKLHLQNKLSAVMGLSSCSFLWFQRGTGPSDGKNKHCGKEVLGEMVSENQAGKLEAFRWGGEGWEWVRGCQPSWSPRPRWFHTFLLSPGTSLPEHCIVFTDTLKGKEVGVQIHCLAVNPGRCHIQQMQDTLLDQRSRLFFCLSCACQKCCRDERLWQFCNAEQKPCKEAIQLHQLSLYYFGWYLKKTE